MKYAWIVILIIAEIIWIKGLIEDIIHDIKTWGYKLIYALLNDNVKIYLAIHAVVLFLLSIWMWVEEI